MYEIELKIELTEQEKDFLIATFAQRKFVSKGTTPQNDYYIEAKDSTYGGHDTKRYRKEGNKYIYTEKMWELIGTERFRKEDEHEVTEEEFTTQTKAFPDAVTIIKDRAWFAGNYEGKAISFTIDTVKFKHSPGNRYFLEAEIDVSDKKDAPATKKLIESCLKELLGRTEIIEAPGMFALAFKKL